MRSPVTLLLLLGLLSSVAVRSQSDELMIQGQTGKLYVLHIVAAKETWYSIGRMYNELPKTISAFNKLTMDKPLEIGQQIQIPLTATNFSQSGQKAVAGETLVPVYHVVQEKEWMYRISINHNKVPIASLEKWNHINKDQVKAGMHMVVGFLKVKTALSALAAGHAAPAAPAAAGAEPPAPKPAASTASAPPPSQTSQNKPDSAVPAAPTTSMALHAPASPLHYNGGFFRADFYDGGRTATGLAGTFKSSSGWQDGRYYALMNNVPVGTIVKITDATTARSIFAKVLGQLPDMKESAGLSVRISNAAASELGAGDGRFNVEMKY
ncbi:MAG: LysM domain-containing protein [Bacteroidota bacterium]|nr:LysM domain-containing protein [Bacteroidota bacterium]MDP4217107.1 LysM domain-containing protein [Bacteroidota bacterium]MDP4246403.1 LysM domain-containing protein [Bacteroidota bacterium]MDP4254413.1 LysM domain-containing protein [Bacteroidota bacterium]MDP4256951.1 LysM domain-containing protein [Bacteroidota bacterium]